MDAALGNGLEVTASISLLLRSVRAFSHARRSMGSSHKLARGVRKVFDAIEDRRRTRHRRTASAAPCDSRRNTIDAQPLEAILAQAQAIGRMAKFVFAKRTKAHGLELGQRWGSTRGRVCGKSLRPPW